jgi:hypothetical protein
MRKLQNMVAGLTLGAALCAGVLMAAPAAADVLYHCPVPAPNGYNFVCPDPVFVNGVRYRNTSANCNAAGQFNCFYVQG